MKLALFLLSTNLTLAGFALTGLFDTLSKAVSFSYQVHMQIATALNLQNQQPLLSIIYIMMSKMPL